MAVARVKKVVKTSRSPWFSGPLGWVLADVVPLRVQVVCKGQLGLWSLSPAVERRVLQQLRRRPETKQVDRRTPRLRRGLSQS